MKKIIISIVVLMVLIIIDYSHAQDTSCGIVWEPPIQLSPDSVDCSSPSIAVQGDTVHVTWWNSGLHYPYVRSTNGGKTFEPLREIAPDSVMLVSQCWIMTTGSRLHAFFEASQNNSTTYYTYHMFSNDKGNSWSIPVKFGDTLHYYSSTGLGDTILFRSSKPGQFYLLTKSFDGGLTWQTDTCNELLGNSPQLALTKNYLHLVKGYIFDSSGFWSEAVIQYRKSTDLGKTWSDSIPLSTVNGTIASDPYLAAYDQGDSSKLFVAWRDRKYGGDCCSILGRRSNDNGISFLPEERFDERLAGLGPATAICGKTRVITWIDYLSDGGLMIRVSLDEGETWCRPYIISKGGVQSIKISRGIIHIVWEECVEKPNAKYLFSIFYRRGIILSDQHPRFSISTKSILFNETTISCPKVMQLVVRNVGSLKTLNVQAEVRGESSFSIIPPSASIAPYDSVIFFVTFSPADTGEKTANIIFTHNADGSPDTVSVSGTAVGTDAEVVVTDYHNSGWQMISLPLNTVCPYTLKGLYGYEMRYVIKDTMEIGKGYWKKLLTSSRRFVGYQVSEETVHVNPGWNIIGSISSPLLVSDIISNPPGMNTSQFFGYDRSYITSDTIQPGKAYWVKVEGSGELILSTSSFLTKGNVRIKIVEIDELPPPAPGGVEVEVPQTITQLPRQFMLEQNYPNPFNPKTNIRFRISDFGFVSLKIFDVFGREVKTLVSENKQPGEYEVEWNANDVSSGVYYYRLQAGTFIDVKKMLLLK